jgi:AcrR family transcriptional regulator
MSVRQPSTAHSVLWERSEPVSRPAPTPLSREAIVRSAIGLADTDGLAAVSLRKVAAVLDAGPMRLYGYISSKEDLLELMVDGVYGEMASPDRQETGWREALRSVAYQVKDIASKHPWFVDLLGSRPHLGPNALTHLESCAASLIDMPNFENIDAVLLALRTVNAYAIGTLRLQASELRAELESGMGEAEWQAATGPYIARMLDTGRFPCLTRIVHDAVHPPFDVVFEQGLNLVLDGVAANASSPNRLVNDR